MVVKKALHKQGSQDPDQLSITGHHGYEEYGTESTGGQGTDLTRAITAIQNGTSIVYCFIVILLLKISVCMCTRTGKFMYVNKHTYTQSLSADCTFV